MQHVPISYVGTTVFNFVDNGRLAAKTHHATLNQANKLN